MKKLQFFAAAALAFFATACSNEVDAPDAQSGTETEVAVTLQLPQEIQTYAYGDGTKAPRLHYAVYPHTTDGTVPAPVITGDNDNAFNGSLSTTQNFKVITGVEYDFVFFADNADGQFVFDTATATITDQDAEDGVIDGNKENRDAFFGVLKLKVTGPFSASVELRRPFAQLNLGTNDLNEQIVKTTFGSDLAKLKTSVTTDTYKTLNLLTGVASDKVSVAFGKSDVPDSSAEAYPVDGYDFLSMNYLLMPAELTRQNCVFTIYNTDTEVRSFTVPNVPVQRNYRTNVYGNVLTTDGEVNVIIKPEFEEPDHEAKIWDGNAEPLPAETAEGVITLETPGQLATLANELGTGNTFEGKTVKLDSDFDMNNNVWIPIGSGDAVAGDATPTSKITPFKGVFDGQGHTISNLKIDNATSPKNNYYAGLFYVSQGTVKNVSLKNVNVKGQRSAALVGRFDGGVIENCHVDGAVISSVQKNGGLVGYAMISSDAVIRDCSVKNITINPNADVYGLSFQSGGVMGWLQATNRGNVTFENVKASDITISSAASYAMTQDNQALLYQDCSHAFVGTICNAWKSTTENPETYRIDFNNCSLTGNNVVNLFIDNDGTFTPAQPLPWTQEFFGSWFVSLYGGFNVYNPIYINGVEVTAIPPTFE